MKGSQKVRHLQKGWLERFNGKKSLNSNFNATLFTSRYISKSWIIGDSKNEKIEDETSAMLAKFDRQIEEFDHQLDADENEERMLEDDIIEEELLTPG